MPPGESGIGLHCAGILISLTAGGRKGQRCKRGAAGSGMRPAEATLPLCLLERGGLDWRARLSVGG